MKSIQNIINNQNVIIDEKLAVSKSKNKPDYKYFPKTRDDLLKIIGELIKERGWKANLNDIDTSKITDMSSLFIKMKDFNGDISLWDVSNVKFMNCMFENSKFNGDISLWDVSNVIDMTSMFEKSRFNGDISLWDVSNVEGMKWMFYCSDFDETQGDISKWNVSKVTDMGYMFALTDYDGDLSEWDVSNVKNMEEMFRRSEFTGNNGDISGWVLEHINNVTSMFVHSQFEGNIKPWKKYMNGVAKEYMVDDCPIGVRSHENYPKWIKR